MGSCAGKQSKTSSFTVKLSVLPYKNPSGYTVKIIQPSLFYNLVAKDLNHESAELSKKSTEYIDFRSQQKFKENHVKSAMNIDINVFKESKEDVFKSLKILLDFKNLVIMGEDLVSFVNYISEGLLDFLGLLAKANISLSTVYVLDGNISQILDKFPCFGYNRDSSFNGKHFPLLVYSEDDKIAGQVIQPKQVPQQSQKQVSPMKSRILGETKIYIQEHSRFVHSFEEKTYVNVLEIKNILVLIDNPNSGDSKSKEDSVPVEKALEKSAAFQEKKLNVYTEESKNEKAFNLTLKSLFKEGTPFLIVHEKGLVKTAIESFVQFLENSEKFNSGNIRNYVEERFPKLKLINHVSHNEISNKESDKKKSKSNTEDNLKSRLDEINEVMADLKKSCKNNMETVGEVYNLISKILDNIIKNPEEEKYKSLNETNQKLKDTIFKYAASRRILEIAGFHRKEGENKSQYFNMLDVNTLKHIKVDIDIGYKNIQTK